MIKKLTVIFIFGAVAIGGFGYIVFHFYFSPNIADPALFTARIGGALLADGSPADYNYVGARQKVRVLIVPGHEPAEGGARFGSLYERDLVAEIGQDLQQFLQTDSRYEIFITRNAQSWNATMENYFNNNLNAISAWKKTAQQTASRLVMLGAPTIPPVKHNNAPADVALRLYGITKWANENDIDLMLHLHLSDYPGHSSKVAGKYSGMVIYIPAEQYSNNTVTNGIANAMFKRLSLYNPTSNLPVESGGIIDDPDLIAVGANNTADEASMLIEYDYLYQPQFVNPKVRSLVLKDLAYQTYLGLQDFFTKNSSVSVTDSYNPSSLYAWQTPVTGKDSNSEDIYALQTALIMDNDYPPSGKTKNDCPRSGTFGVCTRAALQAFQKKNGIIGESVFGSKTFNLLNKIYNGD